MNQCIMTTNQFRLFSKWRYYFERTQDMYCLTACHHLDISHNLARKTFQSFVLLLSTPSTQCKISSQSFIASQSSCPSCMQKAANSALLWVCYASSWSCKSRSFKWNGGLACLRANVFHFMCLRGSLCTGLVAVSW